MAKAQKATQDRRDDLRLRLIEIAEGIIASDGLEKIKARHLAHEAGCAVGAIYNVFTDMTDLVMAVNGRTFEKLGAYVRDSVAGRDLSPRETLVEMAKAYLHFAEANNRTWRALFDLDMQAESHVPAWYLAELAKLFAQISGPISELFPDWSDEKIDLMTRALFSAIHGIVLLGLEKRISAVPVHRIEDMMTHVLTAVLDGSARQPALGEGTAAKPG